MDSAVGNQVRVIVVDLRRSLKNDYRFATFFEILRDVTAMAFATAGRCRWTHLGISLIREDKAIVLQNLQDFSQLSMSRLEDIFQQLNQAISSETDLSFIHHYDEKTSKKQWDLNRTLQNALKQYRELQMSGGDLWITVVSLQWEMNAKAEIRQFQRNTSRSTVAYKIQVLDVGEYSFHTERVSEKVVVTSIPTRGISIVMESILKAWLKGDRHKLCLGFSGKDLDLTCQMESTFIDPHGIQMEQNNPMVARAPIPRKIFIRSFIAAVAVCPSLMYDQCYSVSPIISRAENYNRYEALWKFIEEKRVAIIAQSDEEKSQTFAIFPGSELRMTLQPIASGELILPLTFDEDLLISRPTSEFENLARQLPIVESYSLGFEANLIAHVKNLAVNKHHDDSSDKFPYSEGIEHASRKSMACRMTSRPRGQRRQTKPQESRRGLLKGARNSLAHPALAMYN